MSQPELDFDQGTGGRTSRRAVVEGKASLLLAEGIRASWDRLGLVVIHDEAFFQLLLAGLVEPTTKLNSLRVIEELGLPRTHRNTLTKALKRRAGRDYGNRSRPSASSTSGTGAGGDVSLLIYDVTTLHPEADNGDELRKGGFSEERRVDPQTICRATGGPHQDPVGDRLFRGQSGRDQHHHPDRVGVLGTPPRG